VSGAVRAASATADNYRAHLLACLSALQLEVATQTREVTSGLAYRGKGIARALEAVSEARDLLEAAEAGIGAAMRRDAAGDA
jgi:hypothetical protein